MDRDTAITGGFTMVAGILFFALLALLLRLVFAGVTDVLDFPDAADLREIEQELLPQVVEDDPIFNIFPIVELNEPRLIWEQMDNYTGLQQVRGIGGLPRLVQFPGSKRFDMEPGIYGEFTTLNENDVTNRRLLGTWGEPIDIDDLIGRASRFLLQRRIDRIRLIIWTLVSTGTFSVPAADGTILHTDTFPLKTLSVSVDWRTSATAIPTTDIRAAQLLSRGQSVDFGAGAEIWMNRTTANALLSNTNPGDLFGRRVNYGNTLTNNLSDVNAFLEANDLPKIVIYDRGYIDSAGNFQLFIPSGKAVLIGRRLNGAKLGNYFMTRNFVNPKLEPGPYTRVIDRRADQVPGHIEVHDGHNGGPGIMYPGAICIITVW